MERSLRQSPGWNNPLHCFVALCGGRDWRGACAAAWLLRVCWALTPVTSPTPCIRLVPLLHCCPGVNPGVGGFVYVLRPRELFKWSFLKIRLFLPLLQPPLVFMARRDRDLSSWPGTLGSVVWPVVWITCSQDIPSSFFYHTWMWDQLCPFCCHCLSLPHDISSPLHTVSVSPPLLPIWMSMAFLNP